MKEKNQSDLKETEPKMKFDEEDLLDLINGGLNDPAKDQKELNKNDLLGIENNREPDIMSVSTAVYRIRYTALTN